MAYYIKNPTQFTEKYLNEIDISDFVDLFKEYKSIMEEYYSFEDDLFLKSDYNIKKVIDFIEKTKFFKDKLDGEEIKLYDDFMIIYDKYKSMLINNSENDLKQYHLNIIVINDDIVQNKFETFINSLEESIVCHPLRSKKRPFWMDCLPYPSFSCKENSIYFQQVKDSSFTNNLKEYKGHHTIRMKINNIILVVNDKIYYLVTGGTGE